MPINTLGIDRAFEQRLAAVINAGQRGVLRGGLKGAEKESLRVTPQGQLAQTPHPQALGSALTNEFITTDYSEALIELVTPPVKESWELLQFLCDLHQFVYRHLGDELLWATSMPCSLDGDAGIPIGRYGTSNRGKMKEVYREGLGWRYGRMMQAISGVHFNYSFPDHFWGIFEAVLQSRAPRQEFISEQYFAVLRNYRRFGWLVLYLFGNSPALSDSFVNGRAHTLRELLPGTLYEPYATSLRMSDLGYRNKTQSGVRISVNSLKEYVRDLAQGCSTVHPDYERLGVKVNGHYRQLNANLLQIENEYYSFIRPKRIGTPNERPTHALARAGVQYVEVRALDVSAFDPVGVNQHKLRFLEAFLLLCVLKDSPPIENAEQGDLDNNHAIVAHRGREPGLLLKRQGRVIPLRDWSLELIDGLRGVCELLDEGEPHRPYKAALEAQESKIYDVALTPAARTLAEMRSTGESFSQFALRMSQLHKAYFTDLYPPNESRLQELHREAGESQERQTKIEAAAQAPFDDYLRDYFRYNPLLLS